MPCVHACLVLECMLVCVCPINCELHPHPPPQLPPPHPPHPPAPTTHTRTHTQANQRIMDAAAQRLGLPHDRVVSNLAGEGGEGVVVVVGLELQAL